ncbi:Adaptin ear-binding coat-associated protein, putative [Perkinsus marinus ATCC 50983]|uniref:Adaptin ear-binding coat-associated protein, putative n=1 Tax=Perkinsus marinus (strain ATCC 50983 / TXsc) TaxID=423536 RepID=C5LUE9_PERM5|nr:Adaptin ear-binding coat-associated protein, putative [Perkinsus marinus ATCC 50983]EEQ99682.1 Adaptin ear-binding coat-associated protein, putative [Perkinsus marinus ATCC 50983]|eukprot:XP_002766965.1 Adaptin ear-binding coat-associated protein, putative [Perkinsus marinus ATCC 50983]
MLNESSAGGDSEEPVPDDNIEYVLLNKPECYVYNVPPSTRGRGHKAGEWTNCIWRGRLQVAAKGAVLVIKFVDASTGGLFAACPIAPNTPIDKVVERTVDSSRYFVLRLSDGSGHHAYLGVGFEDRNDAFDFNACLYDFDRQRSQMGPSSVPTPGAAGQKDLINPLREKARQGEGKVTVRLKGMSTTHQRAAGASPATAQQGPSTTGASDGSEGPDLGSFLPPPPMAGRSRHGGSHRSRRAPASGTSHGSVQVSTVDDLLDFNASGPPTQGPPAQQEPPLDGNLEAPNAAPNPYTQPVPGYALPPQGTMASPYIGQPGYAYPPMQGAPVGGPQSVAAAAAPQLAMPSQGQYSVPVPQPLQAAGNPPPVQVDSAMSDQQAQQGMSPAAPAPVGEASDTVPDRAAADPDSSHSEVAIGKQDSGDASGQQEKAGDSIGSVPQFAENAHNTQTQRDATDSNSPQLPPDENPQQ